LSSTNYPAYTSECGLYEQGFLTDKNRFVDRFEAFDIAESSDQLNDRPRGGSRYLFSEDIY
jgi:hypothetical protein